MSRQIQFTTHSQTTTQPQITLTSAGVDHRAERQFWENLNETLTRQLASMARPEHPHPQLVDNTYTVYLKMHAAKPASNIKPLGSSRKLPCRLIEEVRRFPLRPIGSHFQTVEFFQV